MNSDLKLYEMIMNDIFKNPVNIAGNILVCNRGCNLRWTLGEIDSFTITRNIDKGSILLTNLMYKNKEISSIPNKYVVTFNGGANGYSDKNYILNSISFNFPNSTYNGVYHGGSLSSGYILLTFKANDNSNLILVFIIPTELDKGHGISDMNPQDIAFYTNVVNNIPSKHENNNTNATGINAWSVDMLLPRKGTESSKDHSFYSFVSPENSNICYIYFQHATEITDTLLQSVVGNKGTPSYNAYIKQLQEKWIYPNPDNMVIFGNRDIPSETADEMINKLNSGNVKCNVHQNNDYVGSGSGNLKEGKINDGIAIPTKSENIVNIYIDEGSNQSQIVTGTKLGTENNKYKDSDPSTSDKNNSKGKHWVIIGIVVLFLLIGIGFLIYIFKDTLVKYLPVIGFGQNIAGTILNSTQTSGNYIHPSALAQPTTTSANNTSANNTSANNTSANNTSANNTSANNTPANNTPANNTSAPAPTPINNTPSTSNDNLSNILGIADLTAKSAEEVVSSSS